MLSIQLLLLSTLSFNIGCNQPKVSESEIASPTVIPAVIDENKEEMPQPTSTAAIGDVPETIVDAPPAKKMASIEPQKTNTTPKPNTNLEPPVESPSTPPSTTSSEMIFASHEVFNAMLQKFVSAAGSVNYAGWKKSEADLDNYLQSLAVAIPSSTTSKDEALAYWINAYNAFTVKLILKNYPIASITDLNAGKPWDVKWITLAGKKYSLDEIENKVIRPTFKEPRIHFALNCAAKSCPPLANKAFTATNLSSMLEQRTASFINSNLNSVSKEKLVLSKLFDWYKEDFGNVIAFVNKYANVKANSNASITYNEYNWALNK